MTIMPGYNSEKIKAPSTHAPSNGMKRNSITRIMNIVVPIPRKEMLEDECSILPSFGAFTHRGRNIKSRRNQVANTILQSRGAFTLFCKIAPIIPLDTIAPGANARKVKISSFGDSGMAFSSKRREMDSTLFFTSILMKLSTL
jgi:hypothetical protein